MSVIRNYRSGPPDPVTICVQISVTLLITQAMPCPSDTTQTAILPAITQLVTPTAQIAHNCFFVIYSPPFFRVPYRINPSDHLLRQENFHVPAWSYPPSPAPDDLYRHHIPCRQSADLQDRFQHLPHNRSKLSW